jgi:hypothetical protein
LASRSMYPGFTLTVLLLLPESCSETTRALQFKNQTFFWEQLSILSLQTIS